MARTNTCSVIYTKHHRNQINETVCILAIFSTFIMNLICAMIVYSHRQRIVYNLLENKLWSVAADQWAKQDLPVGTGSIL